MILHQCMIHCTKTHIRGDKLVCDKSVCIRENSCNIESYSVSETDTRCIHIMCDVIPVICMQCNINQIVCSVGREGVGPDFPPEP